MEADGASLPDWRDGAAYAPLLRADRALFAWEWLRRDPGYRRAVLLQQQGAAGASAFGLVAFEGPDLAVPRARPLWSAAVHPPVLHVSPGVSDAPNDRLDVGALNALATVVEVSGCEHLLLTDGFQVLRLDAPAGTFGCGSVSLRYHLEGIASAAAPLLSLRRLLALCRHGCFSNSLHPAERKARRWILMLRAVDALAAGARQRDIACELISRTVSEQQWRSREPSARAQAQRLVRSARGFAAGDWRALLR